MGDYRTLLEQECHDTLMLVRDWLTKSKSEKLWKHQYLEAMGAIRNTIVRLENKQYGCPAGTHPGRCNCRKGL